MKPETVGVSIATPHWCPTNVQCDEYMREKVKRAIRQYARMESTATSPYKFNQQYALSMLKHKRARMEHDKAEYDEWHRVFKIEFRDATTYMQLADRENRRLDHYLK
tara:strand:+ start:189 stop:509 length:321 start_codon:yes stop_codon:yes gene_type:complete